MDKTFIVYVAVGVGFLYFINTFMQDIGIDEKEYQTTNEKIENSYSKYIHKDNVGEDILDVREVSAAKQIDIWNHVGLRYELVDLFPDFDTMRLFVKNSVEGEPLRTKLLKHIDKVEDEFLSGKITAEDAKKALSRL